MLNALRKGAGTWAAKLLFLLLVLSFGAWGIGDFLRPNVNTTVATVGNIEISQTEYAREFRREMERLRSRFGGMLTQELALQLGLGSQVLSSLVERKLLSLEAHELGIRVSDDLVRQRILSEPGFQEGGGFDRRRFAQALQANGLNEDAFVAILRDDITRQLVSGAVTAGVSVPQTVAESLYRYRQEERVAELLFLPNGAAGTVPDPGEADVGAYYEENKERYTTPEYRALTVLFLRPDELASQMQPAEERLREAYESRQSEFAVPEAREVSQLLFTEEAAARAAAERLRGGAAFDAVASEAAAAGAQRTDLGEVRKGDLFPTAVETAVFGLPDPGSTEPVQSPLGWHVLNVAKIAPGSTRPYEAIGDDLRREIAHEQAVDEIVRLSNRIDDALAGGGTLDEVASQVNLAPRKIDAVDRTGKDEAGKPIEDLPHAQAVLNLAFETGQGEVSRLTETPDGGYFIVRVDRVTPRTARPLESVRDQVVAAWREEQARKLAEAEAQKLAERVRAGESLADVGRSRGLEPRTTSPFTRQTNLPGDRLPAPLVEKLFRGAVGEVAVEPTPEGVVIAKLTEIRPADPSSAGDRVSQLREDLVRRMTTDIQAQYSTALQNRHGVKIDEAALRRAL